MKQYKLILMGILLALIVTVIIAVPMITRINKIDERATDFCFQRNMEYIQIEKNAFEIGEYCINEDDVSFQIRCSIDRCIIGD